MTSVSDLDSIKDADLVLPPDVTPDGLRDALRAMSAIVGAEYVKIYTRQQMKPDDEGHYFNLPKEHDLFYILEKDTFLASAVVCPGSTEDVSAIVKVANTYLTPLWPTSMGRNLGALSTHIYS
jgi:FAD/FMN-containing dehydrogenase